MSDTNRKYEKLKEFLGSFESMLIAYSGGVDSTFLTITAHKVLQDKLLAVTAKSETYPESESNSAKEIADNFGFRHKVIETCELSISNFADNPPDRCYYCKRELFQKLKKIAAENNIFVVADGSTCDDDADFRPGRKALSELGIISPLKDCGLYKDDIRKLSKEAEIPTSDKGSFACLASRFPYGNRITSHKLNTVAKAEDYLRTLGLKQFRVRHHGEIARIEVLPEDIKILSETKREEVVGRFKEIGFNYITLDLEGYRTGSMNELLQNKEQYF